MARHLTARKSFAERMHVDLSSDSKDDGKMSPRGLNALMQGKGAGAKKKGVARGAREDLDMEVLAPAALLDAAQKGSAKDILRIKESASKLDLDLCDENGRTPLMWTAELGFVSALQTLLQLGAERTKRDINFGRSALHLAARAGEADAVQALLDGLKPKDQAAYANEPDSYGFSPIFLAQQRGDVGAAAYSHLINAGAVVDHPAHCAGQFPPAPPAAGPAVVRRSIVQAYDI